MLRPYKLNNTTFIFGNMSVTALLSASFHTHLLVTQDLELTSSVLIDAPYRLKTLHQTPMVPTSTCS